MNSVTQKDVPWYKKILEMMFEFWHTSVLIITFVALYSAIFFTQILCSFVPNMCKGDSNFDVYVVLAVFLAFLAGMIFLIVRFIKYIIFRKTHQPIEEKEELKMVQVEKQ